jgi:hypothetical protein
MWRGLAARQRDVDDPNEFVFKGDLVNVGLP